MGIDQLLTDEGAAVQNNDLLKLHATGTSVRLCGVVMELRRTVIWDDYIAIFDGIELDVWTGVDQPRLRSIAGEVIGQVEQYEQVVIIKALTDGKDIYGKIQHGGKCGWIM